jgi:hypothetical protein
MSGQSELVSNATAQRTSALKLQRRVQRRGLGGRRFVARRERAGQRVRLRLEHQVPEDRLLPCRWRRGGGGSPSQLVGTHSRPDREHTVRQGARQLAGATDLPARLTSPALREAGG